MENTIFDDLVQSLIEAKAIRTGKMKASRRYTLEIPDAKMVREKTGLSQSEFARLLHVSLRTLQNWEQHRRIPTGAAAALLKIVEKSPKLAIQALH